MLLEVKDLVKHFPLRGGRFVQAVDGVSFGLERGGTFGLVGESGCGKSTLARLIVRLYRETAGAIFFEGREITALRGKNLKDFRRNVQMVFQDPYASLNPRMTVRAALTDPLHVYRIGTAAERRQRAEELLQLVGLDGRYALRYPHEFSGGQRQRIGIARALALSPKLVVLDEPVSALDVSVQAQILNLLVELQQRLGLAYLFISHDLSVIEYMCGYIGVMYLGRIVEKGSRDDIFQRHRHPYTRALLSAVPAPDGTGAREQIILQGDLPSPSDPPPGCHFCPRCPQAEEICRKEAPVPKILSATHVAACHFLNEP
ncbi:MAG: ATP-binding cassette domain-containing protein [Gracilibacteraceae bacterium]|jgi:oligopeptide/dipeptide ABC transporter ATP-binding protein|nr:ATP-binding cassette domain-containing protein [Gracilibacteraceae bacterium]